MYYLLIRLMIIATILEVGWSVKYIKECPSKSCLRSIEQASRQMLKIDWNPISMFPEEAKRLQTYSKNKTKAESNKHIE